MRKIIVHAEKVLAGGCAVEERGASLWRSRGMLLLLIAGNTVIYMMIYLRGTYYIPLMEELQINNTQLGMMGVAFGVTAALCYFPGGWLADRLSARKLLAISYILTGLGGFYFASFPSSLMCVLLHAYWGVTTSLIFWAASIKATRQLAAVTEQGRAYGFLEAGHGLVAGILLSLGLALFARLGSSSDALSLVITAYAILCLLFGVITWLFFKEEPCDDRYSRDLWSDIIKVVKMPKVWLITLIIFCAHWAVCTTQYLVPFSSQVFGASVVFGAALSIMKDYVRPIVAAAAGIAGDRIGSSKVISFGFIVLLAGYVSLLIVPGRINLLILLIINSGVVYLAMYMIRALYYALLEEGDIPLAISGTAVGLIATFGYVPEIFVPMVGGRLLDLFPGLAGYRYLFTITAVLLVVGYFVTVYWMKITREKRRKMLALRKKGVFSAGKVAGQHSVKFL